MARPLLLLVATTALLLQLWGGADAFQPHPLPTTTTTARGPLQLQQPQRAAAAGLVRMAAGGIEGGKKEFFKLSHGKMEFGTVDRVEMVLYEDTSLIHRYITESPDRIILATWDEELVDRKARDVFRLTTKPMQFVTLNLQPSIDVRVSAGAEALLVESLAHSMNGVEQILGQRFAQSLKIEVKGKLRAVPGGAGGQGGQGGLTKLVGDVQFFTSGQLPLIFTLTPRPVLEGAAVAINRRIMSYAKGKFVQNLSRDFDAWAAAAAKQSQQQQQQQQQQQRKAA